MKIINMGTWMLINHYDHYIKKRSYNKLLDSEDQS